MAAINGSILNKIKAKEEEIEIEKEKGKVKTSNLQPFSKFYIYFYLSCEVINVDSSFEQFVRSIFYVGKGVELRCFKHIMEARPNAVSF